MTHITLKIPDNKTSFFLQLIKEFNYVDIEKVDSTISEEHKNMVREIKLHTKIEDFIDADSFMNNLKKEII
jgi:hypothetical protein